VGWGAVFKQQFHKCERRGRGDEEKTSDERLIFGQQFHERRFRDDESDETTIMHMREERERKETSR